MLNTLTSMQYFKDFHQIIKVANFLQCNCDISGLAVQRSDNTIQHMIF